MKIGVVVDNDFDTDIRVKKEVSLLRKNGFEVYVLAFGDKTVINQKEERIFLSKRLRNILFLLINRLPFYEYVWSNWVKSFINKYDLDIIHTHDLYMSKCCRKGIEKSNKNCKLILDLHENFPHAINSYSWTKDVIKACIAKPKKWFEKENEYLNYADKIIVLSEEFKKELTSKFNIDTNRLSIYSNSIDFDLFDSFKVDTTKEKKDNVELFYFGVVAKRRGIFEALNVFKELNDPNLSFKIIGPIDKADRKEFFDIIEPIKNQIDYIRWIPIQELLSYLFYTDICIAPFIKNPQHESGVANKIYQYMYGKKAIIASNCTPQKQLIETANCGIIYQNLDEFKQALKALSNNKIERVKLGNNGFVYLNENFRNDDSLIKLYQTLN
jgi:glycosyltransferase involved in cell wall biosynthesis